MQDQEGCKKDNIRAKEDKIIAGRTKQHEDEEEDTGIRPKTHKKCVNTKYYRYYIRQYKQ